MRSYLVVWIGAVVVLAQFDRLKQSSVLLHSSGRSRRSDDIDSDDTRRIITFATDQIHHYAAHVHLQPSIVAPDALDDKRHDNLLPRIFAGSIQSEDGVEVGTGKFQFQTNDILTRFTIRDGHHDGALHAELDLESPDEDLLLYREKQGEHYHRGTCATPLGMMTESVRHKRSTDETLPMAELSDVEVTRLISREFPRECSIKIVADQLFHENVGKNETEKTISYMISVIDRANDIFKATDWLDLKEYAGKGSAKDFAFTIKKIEIWNDPSNPDKYLNQTQILKPYNKSDTDDEEHPQCSQPDSRDICRYLKQFSKTGDHGDVCLAHLFTYHDFDAGILGLAHIGKYESVKGDGMGSMGICAGKQKDRFKANQNTALTTTLNWGKRILSTEAELVTVHELGHNWGSTHDNMFSQQDDAATCEPGEPEGNYIMHRNAVSGESPNNDKFSPCSKRHIVSKLLQCGEKYFTKPKNTTCGNFRVEQGEECDPGQYSHESIQCCTKQCRLKDKAVCDDKNPTENLCCNKCQFASGAQICRKETDCKKSAYCSGTDALCPKQVNKEDGGACTDKDGLPSTCQGGKCMNQCEVITAKFAAASNVTKLHTCYCTGDSDASERCMRCCGSQNSTCLPAHQWLSYVETVPSEPIWMPINSTCTLGICKNRKNDKDTDADDEIICKKTQDIDIFDLVNSVWVYLKPSEFAQFAKNNIVGAVMIFSAIFWIPISIFISWIDRKRRQHNEKTRFQWPDYMSSFSQTYSSTYGGGHTFDHNILRQLSLQQKLQQANSGSYALQVMNQLTHHILQESNVKNNNQDTMMTPRSDDFQAAPDFVQKNNSNNNDSSKAPPLTTSPTPSPPTATKPSAESTDKTAVPSHKKNSHSKVLQKGLEARISWFASQRGSIINTHDSSNSSSNNKPTTSAAENDETNEDTREMGSSFL